MAAGRSEYTEEDDQQIIDYLEKYHNVMSIKGMGIYKNMVAEGIPQNRTHDSVRNRALKSIIRHLHLYKVSNALKAKLLDSNLLRSKNGDLTATSSASHMNVTPKKIQPPIASTPKSPLRPKNNSNASKLPNKAQNSEQDNGLGKIAEKSKEISKNQNRNKENETMSSVSEPVSTPEVEIFQMAGQHNKFSTRGKFSQKQATPNSKSNNPIPEVREPRKRRVALSTCIEQQLEPTDSDSKFSLSSTPEMSVDNQPIENNKNDKTKEKNYKDVKEMLLDKTSSSNCEAIVERLYYSSSFDMEAFSKNRMWNAKDDLNLLKRSNLNSLVQKYGFNELAKREKFLHQFM